MHNVGSNSDPTGSEPDVSDGCDKDGFPGGCERAGHTPKNCPGFQIGDTVRFTERVCNPGDTGVIVAEEVWTDPDHCIAWDGVGERPAYSSGKWASMLAPPEPRWLVALTGYGRPRMVSLESVNDYRDRCLQLPHKYPYCWARDIELVSRPEIRVLDDSGVLGSVIGRAEDGTVAAVSDSAAGARRDIALMKVSHGFREVYDG